MFCGPIQGRKVLQARGHIGMVGAERLFPDRKRSPVERLGLGVVALVLVQQGQTVQASGHIGMLGAERAFSVIASNRLKSGSALA